MVVETPPGPPVFEQSRVADPEELAAQHGQQRVIGRELLPGEEPPSPRSGRTIMLGKNFVIFFKRGSGKGARFVLPPIAFRELESVPGLRRVCSSSPSTVGDMHIRRAMGLKDDPKLASILVGFDLG